LAEKVSSALGGIYGDMVKRVTFLVLGTLIFALVVSGVAMAGHSPQNIYDDFRAHGKLVTHYTDAELHAYLNDAQIHEYGDSSVTGRLDNVVLDLVTRETFPFTGFQLMMAGIVVVALIGGGIALRRLSRPHKPSGPSEES
jgi:hypothetical protein